MIFTGDIRKGLEGAHVYKINGYYYLYCTYGGLDGIQVALRSRNIYGPYEQKIVISDPTPGINFGIHQGALIQTQTGEWWTVLFDDSGPFGRFPSLQPVTWVDDWPMVGVEGKGVITYKKPDVGATFPIKTLPTSDEFDQTNLGKQASIKARLLSITEPDTFVDIQFKNSACVGDGSFTTVKIWPAHGTMTFDDVTRTIQCNMAVVNPYTNTCTDCETILYTQYENYLNLYSNPGNPVFGTFQSIYSDRAVTAAPLATADILFNEIIVSDCGTTERR